jgi:hypothetical protein
LRGNCDRVDRNGEKPFVSGEMEIAPYHVHKTEGLTLRLQHSKIDGSQAVDQLDQILEAYSSELPIAAREG